MSNSKNDSLRIKQPSNAGRVDPNSAVDGKITKNGYQKGKVACLSMLMAATVSAGLSGCASYNRDHFTVGSVPDDYRTRHPIVVSESERSTDIVVASNDYEMSNRSKNIVREMGKNFKSSGTKTITVLIPSGSNNEKAARRMAQQAVSELRESGVQSNRINIQHYSASGYGEAATLRLVYTGLNAAVASQCGSWNEDITDTKNNKNYSNFGCATQNNLAQMIANPADLLGPRATAEIDPTRRTNVIEAWRSDGSGS